MNQVEEVKKKSGESVRFGFDAVGRKCFREALGPGAAPLGRLDYVGDCVFEDGVLRLVMHDEGRIVRDSDEDLWRFQYFLGDHLGNVRVAFEVRSDGSGGNATPVNAIIYAEDYYPFGLRMNGNQSEEADGTALKHLFGGKEFQGVMGLQWYDFGARMLDPVVGRWFVIDPEAEKYPDVTPYGYALNNPVRYMDLDGRDTDLNVPEGWGEPPAGPWSPGILVIPEGWKERLVGDVPSGPTPAPRIIYPEEPWWMTVNPLVAATMIGSYEEGTAPVGVMIQTLYEGIFGFVLGELLGAAVSRLGAARRLGAAKSPTVAAEIAEEVVPKTRQLYLAPGGPGAAANRGYRNVRLDPSGKFHSRGGTGFPSVEDLRLYTVDELLTLRAELEQSIKARIQANIRHGYSAPHAERLADEQARIRSIDKLLKGRPTIDD
jgi:RHS repeat-associated protein